MRLYVVRHPKPQVGNGVCYGASDVACEPSELKKTALMLRDVLPQGLTMVSSPLQRCEHLAQVLQRPGADSAYQTDARLAEMDFGTWEMRPWADIAPGELKAWTDDFAAYRCGSSGESTGQFVQRVALRLLESAQDGQDQVWITHAGVMRALQWLQMQPPAWTGALFKAFASPLETICEKPSLHASAHDLLPALFRDQLHARDWPQGALPFGRVQTWDWPRDWWAVQT